MLEIKALEDNFKIFWYDYLEKEITAEIFNQVRLRYFEVSARVNDVLIATYLTAEISLYKA